MKNYKEIADSVFERREKYETEKKIKRKKVVRTLTPICCVCLVALIGFGAWQGGLFDKKPVQTLEDAVIPGIKDWYGPGEEEPTYITDAQKPTENITKDNNQVNNTDNPKNSENTTNTENDVTQNNKKDDFCEIILTDNYIYKIEKGNFAEYLGGKIIEADKVGDKIADVTLTAGWKNVQGDFSSQETLRGEVFAIKGISENVAAALKFIDKGEALTTTHYYVIMNPDADLSVVKDYIIPSISDNSGETVME